MHYLPVAWSHKMHKADNSCYALSLRTHEEAALAATGIAGLGALVAGVGLWRLRLGSGSRGWMAGALTLALVGTLALGWVATLGGRISHPEIRPAAPLGTATAPADD